MHSGSVRAENEDAYCSSRHVYPPYTDDFSDTGKFSSRSVDNDYASPNSPQINHVYVMSDEKDDSRSPKLNVDYADQVVLAEQMGIASVATTPEQNGPNSNQSNHHHDVYEDGASGEARDDLPDS